MSKAERKPKQFRAEYKLATELTALGTVSDPGNGTVAEFSGLEVYLESVEADGWKLVTAGRGQGVWALVFRAV
jgi:hypothetical protein